MNAEAAIVFISSPVVNTKPKWRLYNFRVE